MIEGAPRLLDDPGRGVARALRGGCRRCSRTPASHSRINPRLVRGLDYYNLTVFEWVTDRLGAQGTICGGGRYDGLFEMLGGKPAPACGFAIGVERVIALLRACRPSRGAGSLRRLRACTRARRARARRWAWPSGCATRGSTCVLHCGGGSFKSQMKQADASGARFAVIARRRRDRRRQAHAEAAARRRRAAARHPRRGRSALALRPDSLAPPPQCPRLRILNGSQETMAYDFEEQERWRRSRPGGKTTPTFVYASSRSCCSAIARLARAGVLVPACRGGQAPPLSQFAEPPEGRTRRREEDGRLAQAR